MLSVDVARRANGVFLARLEEQVATLQKQVFPGQLQGPYHWLAIVRGLIDTAYEYLRSSGAVNLPDPLKTELIIDAGRLGQLAVECLGQLSGAEASEIPFQIVRPLQRWLDELGIRHTCFFRAEHAPNYELTRFEQRYFSVRDPSSSLSAAVKRVSWPVHRVTVPSRSLGMLPYFAVVAHEAGHAIYDGIAPTIQSAIEQHPSTATMKAAITSGLGGSMSTGQSIRLVNIRNNWIEEFAADCIAHHIVGPAFYFALFGFLEMASPGLGLADTHPPSYARRELLFQELSKNGGFAQIFSEETGENLAVDINSPGLEPKIGTAALIAKLRPSFDPDDAVIMAHLVEYMEQIHGIILAETRSHIERNHKRLHYTESDYRDDLRLHLEPLCALIPPIEFLDGTAWRPARLATILNVGWAVQLTKLANIHVTDGQFGDRDEWRTERLHSLLLKAVELAEARQAWDEIP